MSLLHDSFLWVGANFTTDLYMVTTKVQGILWSAADIVLIFVFLRIAAHARLTLDKNRIVWRYYLLWLSAILTPLLLFTETPRDFFVLETLIVGIQYAILIFSVVVERTNFMEIVQRYYS